MKKISNLNVVELVSHCIRAMQWIIDDSLEITPTSGPETIRFVVLTIGQVAIIGLRKMSPSLSQGTP